jgi:nucleotide-binding universal stress UspA family protein
VGRILEPGMQVGGFTLREHLHAGSMASLWRVEREGEATPMVMKLPRVRDGDDPAAIVGFEVEQMIMPRLTGPHVPRFVAAAGFDAEQPFIVMEAIGGPTLRDRLDASPLPPGEVAAIGARVADALHDLHRQHVSHLDLKPSQVLWRPGGEAVLIDYGLSRHDRLPDLLAEEFRLPMGTGPYISPEQVRGLRDDSRSDLFALGVMLYHLATGRRPFGFPRTVSGLRKRLWRDPVPPRAHVPELPPWLQEVILGCLETDPAHRWQTAAQVALLLRHPEQVPLGARADKRRRDGLRARWMRWFRSIGHEAQAAAPAQRRLASAPIVMVAVDLSDGVDPLAEALRETTRRVIRAVPDARLACVSVLKVARIANDSTLDASGRSLHVKGLAELAHWSRALALPAERVTHHVLEAPDPAAAIVEYASVNHVDHVLMGARAHSSLRRYLGSVSSQVVAAAPCTVTVVRVPGRVDSARDEREPGAERIDTVP